MTSNTTANEPAVSPQGDGGFVRLRIDLGYDGTNFYGWAWQRGSDLRTVQGVLEEALIVVLRLHERARTVCAGRTDTGVHARAQVAHVDIPVELWSRRNRNLERRMNGVLPPDVRVTSIAEAPEGFDARFSPLSRRYAYRIDDSGSVLHPLRRFDVLAYERPLSVALMNQASTALLGEQDFTAFCRQREGATSVRRLIRLGWARHDDGLVVCTVVADAFCHSMVRSLVGCLVTVGEGRRPVDWPLEVLSAKVRNPAVNTIAAHGLTLESVEYPSEAEMAQQAERTRRRRG